jgi:NADH dehydrogenase
MKRVVIVGMGFGGLEAARNLAGHGLDVLVLDRRNFHLFQPLLYQVATAMLDQETIAHSIRAMVRNWPNVNFRMAEVQNIDLANKRVLTATEPIPYDYLIVAAGSITNFFGNAVLQQHAFDLKQLHDAVALRNHILSVYERASVETDPKMRDSLLTFVIVGGGPTGVEFAGSLSELTHHVLDKDFPELKSQRSRIILVESGKELLSMFPRKLQHYALRRLERMGVEVRLNMRVTNAQADRVFFQDGSEIPAHTLFWGAGVRAAPLAETLNVPKVRGGRISVEPDMRLKEHSEVFVIGDLAYLEQDGAPLPMVAPVAIQQGEYVAGQIAGCETAARDGVAQPCGEPFRYNDKGSMAVIGRYSAVGISKGVTFRGFSAWLAWLGLHLYYLIGFRNRIAAILNWGYSFLLFDKQVRLITRDTKAQGDDVAPVAQGASVAGANATTDPHDSAAAEANVVARKTGEVLSAVTADTKPATADTTAA